MGDGRRYRFVLVEEDVVLPVPWQPGREGRLRVVPTSESHHGTGPIEALMQALSLLSRRGEGPHAWGVPLSLDPLAFLIDTVDDAILLRDTAGRVVFQNRAATNLQLGEEGPLPEEASAIEVEGKTLVRRQMTFRSEGRALVLEVWVRR